MKFKKGDIVKCDPYVYDGIGAVVVSGRQLGMWPFIDVYWLTGPNTGCTNHYDLDFMFSMFVPADNLLT